MVQNIFWAIISFIIKHRVYTVKSLNFVKGGGGAKLVDCGFLCTGIGGDAILWMRRFSVSVRKLIFKLKPFIISFH